MLPASNQLTSEVSKIYQLSNNQNKSVWQEGGGVAKAKGQQTSNACRLFQALTALISECLECSAGVVRVDFSSQ